MIRQKKRPITEAEARAMNERATAVVDAEAWEARADEWRVGEFEVRVFEPRDSDSMWHARRVVVRGRVSGNTVEARGPLVTWSIIRCLMRLHYLNTDAGPNPLRPSPEAK